MIAPTSCIGRYDNGQFFGSVLTPRPPRSFWEQRVWHAVLHHFDHDGAYVRTDLWSAGPQGWSDRKGMRLASEMLDRWVAALPGLVYRDIAIQLFEVEIGEFRFGLVDESDEDGEHVELYPNNLGFYPPWDGWYDT